MRTAAARRRRRHPRRDPRWRRDSRHSSPSPPVPQTVRVRPGAIATGVAPCNLVAEPPQVPAVDPGDEAAAEKGDVDGRGHSAIIGYVESRRRGDHLRADRFPQRCRRAASNSYDGFLQNACACPRRGEIELQGISPASGGSITSVTVREAVACQRLPPARFRSGKRRAGAVGRRRIRSGRRTSLDVQQPALVQLLRPERQAALQPVRVQLRLRVAVSGERQPGQLPFPAGPRKGCSSDSSRAASTRPERGLDINSTLDITDVRDSGNTGVGLIWSRQWSSSVLSEVSLGYSRFQDVRDRARQIGSNANPSAESNRCRRPHLQSDGTDHAGRRPHLRGRRGGDREPAFVRPAVRTGGRAPGSARAPLVSVLNRDESGRLAAAFLQDRWLIGSAAAAGSRRTTHALRQDWRSVHRTAARRDPVPDGCPQRGRRVVSPISRPRPFPPPTTSGTK